MSGTYTTIQGDMWDSIAHTKMGDVAYTDKLMKRNQQYLDYYIFPAGITLALPDAEAGAPTTAPPWKLVSVE